MTPSPAVSVLYLDLGQPTAGWRVAVPGTAEFQRMVALADPKLRGEQTIVTAGEAILCTFKRMGKDADADRES